MFETLRPIALVLVALTATGALGGCTDDDAVAARPKPATLSADAIGYYCNMAVDDHLGPKGQVHLPGRSEPLWFTSVRDTFAFTVLPEEPKNALAIYVNDMGRASWDHPEPDTWIEARSAWYVVGSERVGGMGAPETVPFAEHEAAQRFATRHGGKVVSFDEVPESAILGPVEMAGNRAKGDDAMTHTPHGAHDARKSKAPALHDTHDGQTAPLATEP